MVVGLYLTLLVHLYLLVDLNLRILLHHSAHQNLQNLDHFVVVVENLDPLLHHLHLEILAHLLPDLPLYNNHKVL